MLASGGTVGAAAATRTPEPPAATFRKAVAVLTFWLCATLGFGAATASASPVWRVEGELDSAATNPNQGPAITGMACPTTTLCVAVDNGGDVVSSTDPTGGAGTWTTRRIDSTQGEAAELTSVSCSPSGTCAATQFDGSVLASNDPIGGASAWTAAAVESEYHPPSAVSCPTSELCVATNGTDDILTSTNPTGGSAAWQTTQLPGDHQLGSVSCPTARFCAIGDNAGNVVTATDPTGGAGEWRITPLPRYYVHAPGFPRRLVSEEGLDLSCATSRFCAAIAAGSGDLLSSEHPSSGGTRSWKVTNLVPGREDKPLLNITCPSRNLCISWDSGNDVHTSIDPAAGASAFAGTHVAVSGLVANPPVGSVSCPTSELCIAAAVDGTGLYSTDPAAPARRAAQPSLSRGSLSGIAEGAARLRFTTEVGIPPPGRSSRSRSVRPWVAFATSTDDLSSGITATGPDRRRRRFTAHATRGALTIKLRSVASKFQLTIGVPATLVSASLAAAVKHKHVKTLTFVVKPTTADGTHMQLTVALKAS